MIPHKALTLAGTVLASLLLGAMLARCHPAPVCCQVTPPDDLTFCRYQKEILARHPGDPVASANLLGMQDQGRCK